jgi:hypothetical protein
MRDQPVRDLMTSPVRTVRRAETLATAVDGMAAVDGSSSSTTTARRAGS